MHYETFISLWKSKGVCVCTPVELHLINANTVITIADSKDFPVSVRWLELIKNDMKTRPVLEGQTQIIDNGMSMFRKYINFYKEIKTDLSKGVLTKEDKSLTRIELIEENIAGYNSQDIIKFMPFETWCMFSGHVVCVWKIDGLWIVESMTQAYIDLLERVDPLLTATIKCLKMLMSGASDLSVSGMSEDKLNTQERSA